MFAGSKEHRSYHRARGWLTLANPGFPDVNNMNDSYDLVVIGGGSGGLAAAQRAVEYGATAAVIERGRQVAPA